MANSQNQTVPTDKNVDEFINNVDDPQKQADSKTIVQLMQKVSGYPPVMWGPAIIGFGKFHYKYDSGREGDSPMLGFSPRKNQLTLYAMEGASKRPDLFAKLGKHSTSKACLYIKRLSDIDMQVLEQIVRHSFATTVNRTK